MLRYQVLGGAIEIIQSHIGREGNWQDLLNDVAGAWFGFFCIQKNSRLIWIGRLVSIGLLAPPLSLVFLAGWSQLQVKKSFPIIANFESSIDLYGWKGNIERTDLFHSSGNYSLKIHLTTKKYSGVSLTEFYDSWQSFTTLSLDIYNPAQTPIDLTIRVNDARHELGANDQDDRFNKKLYIVNGWNHIEIPVAEIRQAPATRELKMDAIRSLTIFASQLPAAQDIYLDNIRLQ